VGEPEGPVAAATTGDWAPDAAGVAEVLTTAALGAATDPTISILSPVDNKIYALPAGSSGVVVVIDVEVTNVEVSETGHQIRYFLDGEEVETVTTADTYLLLNVPMGRRHLAARLVTADGDELEDISTSLDGIHIRIEAECDGIGADGEAQCQDGLVCSNQVCGTLGQCKYGPVSNGCCDHDLECEFGEYCLENLCVECLSDADCVDDSACTTDSCGPDGQCVWENEEGCCYVDSDCDDDKYCTLEHCDGPNKTCIYEDNPLPNCCNDVGVPPEHAATCIPEDACTSYMCYASHVGLQYCRWGPMINACCTTDVMCNDGNPCTLDACDLTAAIDNGSGSFAGVCSYVDDPAQSDCCVNAIGCDDGDPSTVDTCENNTCVHADDPEHCVLPVTSSMVINELMVDSGAIPDSSGEFIELYNASDDVIDVMGWKIETPSGIHTILPDGLFGFYTTQVVPHGLFLMARSTNPALDGYLKPHTCTTACSWSSMTRPVASTNPGPSRFATTRTRSSTR